MSDSEVSVASSGVADDPSVVAGPSTVVQKPRTERKKVADKQTWQCKAAKLKRDAGQKYYSRTKKTNVKARKVGPRCNDGCFEKIGMEAINEVFKEFWNIGDYNRQNAYIQNLIEQKLVKRRRVDQAKAQTFRRFQAAYKIKYEGVVHSVCRTAFCSILGVSIRRVSTAMEKSSSTGTPIDDKRGKHDPSLSLSLSFSFSLSWTKPSPPS